MAIAPVVPDPRTCLRRPRLRLVDLLVGAGDLRRAVRAAAPRAVGHRARSRPADVGRDLDRSGALAVLRVAVAARGCSSRSVLSVVFTFVYGTAAARSRRAEKVLIPLLDILQSVPILGFLSITVTVLHRAVPALAPRLGVRVDLRDLHVAGVEHDVQLLPLADHPAPRARRSGAADAAHEVGAVLEARRARLDDRAGLERDDELRRRLVLPRPRPRRSRSTSARTRCPGIGSYVARRERHVRSSATCCLAIVVMIVMVLGVNFVFWRPLVAWSEKFRNEQSEAAEQPRSIMLDTLRRSRVPRLLGRPLRPVGRAARPGRRDRSASPIGRWSPNVARRRAGDALFGVVVAVVVALGCVLGAALHRRQRRARRVPARVRARRDHVRARDRRGRRRRR